jgi:hypothetical protein
MQIVEPLMKKCEVFFLSSQAMKIWTVSAVGSVWPETLQIKPKLYQVLEMPHIAF